MKIVTITAEPNEGYKLNAIYVNGEEIVGSTFEVSGDSSVYAVFGEKTPEYNIKVSAIENVSATLVNVGELTAAGIKLSAIMPMSNTTTMSAENGTEIQVNSVA